MTDYVPTVGELRQAYVEAASASMAQESYYAEQVAEFERGIARIRAEALREAAEVLRGSGQADEMVMVVGEEEDEASWVDLTIDEWLRSRADQIEKEEGND